MRCKPLKSLESDEENQANPSNFIWMSLAGLGFAWRYLAAGPKYTTCETVSRETGAGFTSERAAS
jgi:hypothetical protein